MYYAIRTHQIHAVGPNICGVQSELYVSLLKKQADYIIFIVNFRLSVSRFFFLQFILCKTIIIIIIIIVVVVVVIVV